MLVAADATWRDIARHLARVPLAVLPVGAFEQHGPHLPMSTDTLIAQELAARSAAATDSLLLPAIDYGNCWSTSRYPGAMSLSAAILIGMLHDLTVGLWGGGMRGLIIVNGDYGNKPAIEIFAAEALTRHGGRVLTLFYPNLEELASEICDSQPAGSTLFHADEVETSLILAIAPSLVRRERAEASYPQLPLTFGVEPVYLDELSPSGVFGDPHTASPEKGERLLEGMMTAAVPLLSDFAKRATVGESA